MDNGQLLKYQPKDAPSFPLPESDIDDKLFDKSKEANPIQVQNETTNRASVNYQNIGNKVTESLNEPDNFSSDRNNANLGEIIPTMPPSEERNNQEETVHNGTSDFDPSIFERSHSMSGDRLSNKVVDKLEKLADTTDDSAQLYDEIISAREAFQGKGGNQA